MTDLRQELAQTEKPPVKSYCGGKPNYCTPEVTPEVDAVNMSQECVDETAKCEWVGITEDEAKELYEYSATEWQFVQAIEAKLKEKNNG